MPHRLVTSCPVQDEYQQKGGRGLELKPTEFSCRQNQSQSDMHPISEGSLQDLGNAAHLGQGVNGLLT